MGPWREAGGRGCTPGLPAAGAQAGVNSGPATCELPAPVPFFRGNGCGTAVPCLGRNLPQGAGSPPAGSPGTSQGRDRAWTPAPPASAPTASKGTIPWRRSLLPCGTGRRHPMRTPGEARTQPRTWGVPFMVPRKCLCLSPTGSSANKKGASVRSALGLPAWVENKPR